MSERRDERWLDDQLRRVVEGGTPAFDAESWKRRHHEEYEALLSRHGQPAERGVKSVWFARWIAGLAAAAVITVAIALFVPGPRPVLEPQTPPESVADPATEIQSAGVISFESLTLAFRRGGEEALNRQLDTAQETLGPRPDRSLLSDLLNDIRS